MDYHRGESGVSSSEEKREEGTLPKGGV